MEKAAQRLGFKNFDWIGLDFEDIETIEAVKEGDPRIYLTPKGAFPSMTTMLSLITDKKALDAWRKRVGIDEAERIVAESIGIGNALHDFNEKYLKNLLTREDLTTTIDKNVKTASILFSRVKPFLDQIEVVVGAEVALFNKEQRYAGRCDAIGVHEGQLCIIDHKNTRSKMSNSTKWGRQKLWKYKLQCCGYSKALKEMTGLDATHGCLMVGNRNPLSGEIVKFEIDKFLRHDLDILAEVYHSDLSERSKSQKLKNNLTYYTL